MPKNQRTNNKNPKKKESRNRIHYLKFSQKEQEIMEEELSDSESFNRNLSLIGDLLIHEPALHGILVRPQEMVGYIGYASKELSESNRDNKKDKFPQAFRDGLMEQYESCFEPQEFLNLFTRVMKKRKIKREKRVLLWAVGNLLKVVDGSLQARESALYQSILIASMQLLKKCTDVEEAVKKGSEPYHFHYEDYCKPVTWSPLYDLLQKEIGTYIDDVFVVVSGIARERVNAFNVPVGFPFYDILHFPFELSHEEIDRSILEKMNTMGEMTEKDKEIGSRMVQSFQQDLALLPVYECTRKIVQSIQSARGAVKDPEEENELLNAVAFSFLHSVPLNSVLLTFYVKSGRFAAELVADDEKPHWSEIVESPDQPQAYRRYGDRLLEKGEWKGAFKAYRRAIEFLEQSDQKPDEEWVKTFKSLKERWRQEEKSAALMVTT